MIELKANFLGTPLDGAILCRATITVEASGARIALFRCTQMILWPK